MTSTVKLRHYQQEAIQAVRASFPRGLRRVLIGLPTGTGKTVVFDTIASSAVAKGRRVLILAHRDELLSQAADKLVAVDPSLSMSIGFVQGKRDDVDRQVVIASVQTLARQRRLDRLTTAGRFDVVIVDEAHHSAADSYQRVLHGVGCFDEGGPLTIGVSATLRREDSKALADTWQEVVYHRDMLSMILEGYLCELRGLQVRLNLDVDQIRVRRGEYVDADAGEALTAAEAPEYTVRAWQRHAEGRKTIVFTPTIALAQLMAERFREAGVAAESVSGLLSLDERRAALARFASGETTVVCNAQVLMEGFDEPSVSCIVIARPTRSQTMYVQMVGRGTRVAAGKTDCLVMDLVDASQRLDLTTLPSLLAAETGRPLSDEERELVEREGLGAAFAEEVRRGRIIARQVELFSRQDLNWNHASRDLWVLSCGEFSVHLEHRGDDRWDVVSYPRQRRGAAEVVAESLDQGYALGTAEEYARGRSEFNQNLVSRAASWRAKAPSGDQRRLAGKLGVTIPDGATKGEVSDLLTLTIERRRARRAAR